MDHPSMLPQATVTILEEQTGLSLIEVCRACAVNADSIVELVDEGLLAPLGREPHRWLFTGLHVRRATVALRIAVSAPEAVRSLTLIEPVLFAAAPDPANDAVMRELSDLVAAGESEEAARRFLSIWGGIDWDAQTPAGRERLIRQMTLVVAGNDTLMRDSANILRAGGLEAIDAPVMILMGAQSPPVIGNIADALAARLPDIGRARLPEAVLKMTNL